MHIEGRLHIDLYPVAGQLKRVDIQSSRPLQAARIFSDKTPQEVLMQLPLLFSVCGIAQGAAAVKAFQQALAMPVATSLEAARSLLVQMEAAREHLWRILIDWPQLLGESSDARQGAPLHPMLMKLRKALFADGDHLSLQTQPRFETDIINEQIQHLDECLETLVYKRPTVEWLRVATLVEFNDWSTRVNTIAAQLVRLLALQDWQRLGATDCRFLPDLPEVELDRRLAQPDAGQFIAEPIWNDGNYETTPLARQSDCALVKSLRREYGNGLLTRLAARLVELARIPSTMRTLARQLASSRVAQISPALPAGIGIGQVEAARGRLVHRVVLNEGRVQRYQILAPTEWNFHPSGVVAHGLANLPCTDEATLRLQTAMFINAVDPCVGYELRIH